VIAVVAIASCCRDLALCVTDAFAVLCEFSRELDANDLAQHFNFAQILPYPQYEYTFITPPTESQCTLSILRTSSKFNSRQECLDFVQSHNGDTSAIARLWDYFGQETTCAAELLWGSLPMPLRLRIFFLAYAQTTSNDSTSPSLLPERADSALALLDKIRGQDAPPSTLITKRKFLSSNSISLKHLVDAALSDLELVTALSVNEMNDAMPINSSPCVPPPDQERHTSTLSSNQPATGCFFCVAPRSSATAGAARDDKKREKHLVNNSSRRQTNENEVPVSCSIA